MIKTYSYKLYNNEKYLKKYEEWISICRFVYNAAIETREESYKKDVKLSCFDLQKQLTEAKKDIDFLKNVNAQTLQAVIERLEEGYNKFFSDLKLGNKCSKPKWAKKGKFQTLTFKQGIKKTEKGFKLPSFGEVKVFNKEYDFEGKIKQAKLTKKADGLYLNLIVETEDIKRENQSNSIVSLDMRIKYFCTTSDGEFVDNPKHLFQQLRRLRVEQRKLSRKFVKGRKQSKNFYKQAEVVARLHKKVTDTRNDFLHKLSRDLASRYSTLVIEDLKISEMVKNKKFSKHILDCAWGKFFELLESKTNVVRVNPAYSSQECSVCKHTCKENRLTQSLFKCTKCGHEANADFDACLVLLKRYQEGASSFDENVGQ